MELHQVTDKLWRGPAPMSAGDFLNLKQLGFTDILNLESGIFDFFHGRINFETSNAERVGINSVHMAESDFTPPTVSDLLTCVRIIQRSQKIYVHCLHGVDRTGMVVAAYRIVIEGWAVDDAIREMYKYGFHRWSYWWWVPRLRELKYNGF